MASPPPDDWQQQLLQQTQLSLQHLIEQQTQLSPALQIMLQNQTGALQALQQKLNPPLIQIAAFGFVSRGKSAVLNALFAEQIFPVGPLNGETQWPRSVRWTPTDHQIGGIALPPQMQLELVDTPGLDEIEGENRTHMAQTIAATADLILFVVAGIPTPAELEALQGLLQTHRPLLLVVNKADLYRDLTPEQVHGRLEPPTLQTHITPAEIVLTAAAPAPLQVLTEWPDGRSEATYEIIPPQVQTLRQRLVQFLQEEGRCLLMANVLSQGVAIANTITEQTCDQQALNTERLILQFQVAKALLVALLPFFFLDLPSAALCDFLLIGALSKQLNLPTHHHQVNRLWRAILVSLGCLLTAEIMGALLFTLGNAAIFDSLNNTASFWGSALVQAGFAAYGSIQVATVTQSYLITGSTWGPMGLSTLRQQLLKHIKPPMLAARFYPQPPFEP